MFSVGTRGSDSGWTTGRARRGKFGVRRPGLRSGESIVGTRNVGVISSMMMKPYSILDPVGIRKKGGFGDGEGGTSFQLEVHCLDRRARDKDTRGDCEE